jgi:hypothetical protein
VRYRNQSAKAEILTGPVGNRVGIGRGPGANIALMMEAARTSETLINVYQTTRRYNPEDSHLRTHRRENLKSYYIDEFLSS